MAQKLSFWISPFFINKYHLLTDITSLIQKYKFEGGVLDFGCGEKPYKYLFTESNKYEGIDMPDYSQNRDYIGEKPDYTFDEVYLQTSKLHFEDNTFDHVVSFQVLEHHNNPEVMMDELVRITKPGGNLMITFPFLWAIHESPRDFTRYTKYGFIELAKRHGAEVLEIRSQGGLFSTLSILTNNYLADIATKGKIHMILISLIYPPFLVFQYCALALDKIFGGKGMVSNYAAVLVKK